MISDENSENSPALKTEHTLNVPGLPEVGRAIEKATDDIIVENSKALRNFLGKLCGPAIDQYGQAWADHAKQYRYINHLKFLSKAQRLHQELEINPDHTAKPRLMLDVIEASSMEDHEGMQEWWAGLSISSLEENPSDDNLIFINMMKQITSTQKIIIEHICTNSEVTHTKSELLVAKTYHITHDELVNVSGVKDINKLDREIDSLNSMGLLHGGGYDIHSEIINIDLTPSPLCLHFYSRCKGRTDNLIEYLGAELTEVCPRCGRIHNW